MSRDSDDVGPVDFDSLDDHAVAVRGGDAMTQERVGFDSVADYLALRFKRGSAGWSSEGRETA